MRTALFLALFAVLAALPACSHDCRDYEVQCDDVVRVFLHETGEYTVMYKADGQLKTETFWDATIFDDVPDGQPMWAERKWISDNGDVCDYDEPIHIHSAAEIEIWKQD